MSDPNENRAGYKETKVGWIPEEWNPKAVSDLADIRFSGVDKKTVDGETPVRLCNYTDVYYNETVGADRGYMRATATATEIERFELRQNDVLVTKDSEASDDIAVPCFVAEDAPGVLCGYHLALLRPDPDSVSGRYLSYALRRDQTRNDFGRFANGVTRYGLTSDTFEKVEIALAPCVEQQKIADILSTCDEAIEKTGALIDAKKGQKRALMQQLLTGKKRLSGFVRGKGTTPTRTGEIPSDWEWTHLGKLFKKRVERSGDALPLMAITIDSGMVRRDSIERKVDSELTESDNLLARSGDIAYNTMRMWQGAVGVAEEDCHVSPAYVVCAPVEGVADSEFYYYWFKSAEGLHLLWSYSYGITGDRLRLYAADFSLVPAPLPSLKEQRAIVSVLKSAEEEIERLLQKQAALQQQKKSLMQKLLTGQVRVKV